jgi:hypothetical protein
MLFIEYKKDLLTECNSCGSHFLEFFVLPTRLVKHKLHLGAIDEILQLIQAVNHDLPPWLQLQCSILASRRLLDFCLWQQATLK